jgi:hypothetical protein
MLRPISGPPEEVWTVRLRTKDGLNPVVEVRWLGTRLEDYNGRQFEYTTLDPITRTAIAVEITP